MARTLQQVLLAARVTGIRIVKVPDREPLTEAQLDRFCDLLAQLEAQDTLLIARSGPERAS